VKTTLNAEELNEFKTRSGKTDGSESSRPLGGDQETANRNAIHQDPNIKIEGRETPEDKGEASDAEDEDEFEDEDENEIASRLRAK